MKYVLHAPTKSCLVKSMTRRQNESLPPFQSALVGNHGRSKQRKCDNGGLLLLHHYPEEFQRRQRMSMPMTVMKSLLPLVILRFLTPRRARPNRSALNHSRLTFLFFGTLFAASFRRLIFRHGENTHKDSVEGCRSVEMKVGDSWDGPVGGVGRWHVL